MKTFTNTLQAYCLVCSSEATTHRHLTFAYWYCQHCKDETEVRLHLTLTPRGELYAYSPKENPICISEPGVYVFTYSNGSYEWYEHHAGSRDLKLDRGLVSSATRIADRDLPSRKRVQPISNSSEGTQDEGLCVRTFSDAPYSPSGAAQSQAAIIAKALQKQAYNNLLDTFKQATSTFPGNPSGSLSGSAQGQVSNMDTSDKLLQSWPLPPDDAL